MLPSDHHNKSGNYVSSYIIDINDCIPCVVRYIPMTYFITRHLYLLTPSPFLPSRLHLILIFIDMLVSESDLNQPIALVGIRVI